jgi:GT2 family glycosyltransferase
MPTVSIIIPCYNIGDLLLNAINHVRHNTQDINYELIMVNTKKSFASNCNSGVKIANGDYVCLLNDDTMPQKGWLKAMVELAESDPQIGIVGCKMFFPDGSIQHAGMIFHPDYNGGNLHWGKKNKDDPIVNKVRELQAVTFGCCLIKREVFEKIGMIDEGFEIMGYEDVDFCHRARIYGKYKVMYEPKSEVIHYEQQTLKNFTLGQVREQNYKNYTRYAEKWKPFFDDGTLKVDDELEKE